MKFPSFQEYDEFAQNPGLFFTDREIRERHAALDALGLPEGLSGNFAVTYRFCGPRGDIAVRCFHRNVPDLFERYRAISRFLDQLHSAFIEQGLRVEPQRLPVLRMAWIVGETLLAHVERRIGMPLRCNGWATNCFSLPGSRRRAVTRTATCSRATSWSPRRAP